MSLTARFRGNGPVMKHSRHWIVLSIVLAVLGLGFFFYKVQVLGYPLFASETSKVWRVQAQVEIDPGSGPVKVNMKLPHPGSAPNFELSNENFVSRGFGLTVNENEFSREVTWAIRRAREDQTLYYTGVYYQNDKAATIAPVPDVASVPQLEEPFQTALSDIVDDVRSESADIESFAAEVFNRINDPSPDENVALFIEGPLGLERARIAQLVMAGARIPTLLINGIRLGDDIREAEMETLLGVHNGSEWLIFHPMTGGQGLPGNFLVWWTGEDPQVTISGGRVEESTISVRSQTVSSLELATKRTSSRHERFMDYSLLSLPVQTQGVYEVLLLIPIGAFVIVILRNLIGVRSFGTFMPVLIALAFRETELLAGIILFTVIITLGLAIRFYLEKLRLLLVPRLTAIVTIVVLLMAFVSIISNRLGIEVGLSIALFPMVIIAMVIERMSIVWEEQGAGRAIVDGIGSLVIASLAYVVMGIDIFSHWVVVFPELLFVLLGATIALGRYTGYRLSDLFRFRELAGTA